MPQMPVQPQMEAPEYCEPVMPQPCPPMNMVPISPMMPGCANCGHPVQPMPYGQKGHWFAPPPMHHQGHHHYGQSMACKSKWLVHLIKANLAQLITHVLGPASFVLLHLDFEKVA